MKSLPGIVLFTASLISGLIPCTAGPDRSPFLPAPPASYRNGLLGFHNPALPGLLRGFESRVYWSREQNSNDAWGAFTALRGIGVGVQRLHRDGVPVTDYGVSLAAGDDDFSLGVGYGVENRGSRLTAGTLLRPNRRLSLGAVLDYLPGASRSRGFFEAGLRPLKSERLTLFADLHLEEKSRRTWSAGAAVGVLPGIDLLIRRFNDDFTTVGLSLSMGRLGVMAMDREGSRTFAVRQGPPEVSFIPARARSRSLSLELRGRVAHLNYRFFDSGTLRLLRLLRTLRSAGRDGRVGALALNLSGLRILPEHAWELREALRACRSAGVKIYIFIDRPQMTHYHLASVADRLFLDPEGFIALPGYIYSLTYFRGALEKLGLGFDEWRLHRYKSAAEILSRNDMSASDREQRSDYLDDLYNLVRDDVTSSRPLRPEQFDRLVDDHTLFSAEQALAAGLVDTLARWDGVKAMLEADFSPISSSALRPSSQERWGGRPCIAVVYALGVCDLDRGIRARWLAERLRRLAADRRVKALVFRVDSPGGDGMASDMVAEAVRECREKKPVIVSQGQVAGSGGYWISLYGDAILGGPNSVTGSIGVIGGWLYDKGFSKTLGLSHDTVQKGARANYGAGIRLPLLGLQLPARNLNPDERLKIEGLIRNYYDHFVTKVAGGRNLDETRVREIAEGRFYSGSRGAALGLVDRLGGLLDALDLARMKAGLAEDQVIKVIEIPDYAGLFNLQPQIALYNGRLEKDPLLRYIQMVSEYPGQPVPMMVPGSYPSLD